MPDILGFKPNRGLEFNSNRGLDFKSNRPLEFDSRRPLTFQPNRDLGFGRRGVVFRGYVCPICGALTSETAVRCSECGAVFEGAPPKVGPSPPRAESVSVRGGPPAPSTRVPSARRTPEAAPSPPSVPQVAGERRSAFCARCGARRWESDAFCWNCGARIAAGTAAAELPHRRT